MKIIEKIEGITFKIYKLIFKEKPTENVKIFIKNFNYVAIGFGFSAIFGFLSQILMGRFLGPEGYGKYSLVQSISFFFYVPMGLGISTALIKYNAEEDNIDNQKKIISTSFFINLCVSFIIAFIILIFSKSISSIFGVPILIFFAILFSLLYNFYIFVTDTLRSLHKMKELSIFQVIDGALMLLLIVFFIINNKLSFEISIFIACITYFVVFIFIIFNIRRYILSSIDLVWFKKIIRYGVYAMLWLAIYVFLQNFSKLLINKLLQTSDVGIYSAYYFSSFGMLGVFLGMFITVFFPMASRQKNKKILFEKIDKFLPYLFLLVLPIFLVIEFVVLKLYGSKYPIDISLMLEFVIAGMLMVIYSLYDNLFASHGILGIKLVVLSGSIVVLSNIVFSFKLISLFGLHGAVISVGVSYLLGIFIYSFLRKKII